MRPKPSGTLATIIANAAIRAERNPHISLLNAVGVELVNYQGCHANHIMSMVLDSRSCEQIALRAAEICSHTENIDHSAYGDTSPLDILWSGLVEQYTRSEYQNSNATIHTGHLLHYVMCNSGSHLGRILCHYGVSLGVVEMFNANLPSSEDYYSELLILQSFANSSSCAEA